MTPRPPLGGPNGELLRQARSRVFIRGPVIYSRVADAALLGLGPRERSTHQVDYVPAVRQPYWTHRPDTMARRVDVPDDASGPAAIIDEILTVPPPTEADRIRAFLDVIGV